MQRMKFYFSTKGLHFRSIERADCSIVEQEITDASNSHKILAPRGLSNLFHRKVRTASPASDRWQRTRSRRPQRQRKGEAGGVARIGRSMFLEANPFNELGSRRLVTAEQGRHFTGPGIRIIHHYHSPLRFSTRSTAMGSRGTRGRWVVDPRLNVSWRLATVGRTSHFFFSRSLAASGDNVAV